MIPDQSPAANKVETDEEILKKRIGTLIGILDALRQRPGFDLAHGRLDDIRMAKTVEEYLLKMKAIKARDKIEARIQRHKIAGLMAASIIHNQPLRAFFRDDFEGPSVCDPWGNRIFAIYHGVAICGEGIPDKGLTELSQNPKFQKWVEDFEILLKCGSPCEDSLIHIFGTLCFGFFPQNFGHSFEEKKF